MACIATVYGSGGSPNTVPFTLTALRGLFRQIIEDRTDILYPIKDLEVHRGLGFAAWCDNNRNHWQIKTWSGRACPCLNWNTSRSTPRTARCRFCIWPCPAICTPCS